MATKTCTMGPAAFASGDDARTNADFACIYQGSADGAEYYFNATTPSINTTSHDIGLANWNGSLSSTITTSDPNAPTITNISITVWCANPNNANDITLYVAPGTLGNTKSATVTCSTTNYGTAQTFSGDMTYWGLTQTEAYAVLSEVDATDTTNAWKMWFDVDGSASGDYRIIRPRMTVTFEVDDTGWESRGPYGFSSADDVGQWAFVTDILVDDSNYARCDQGNDGTAPALKLSQWGGTADTDILTDPIPADAKIQMIDVKITGKHDNDFGNSDAENLAYYVDFGDFWSPATRITNTYDDTTSYSTADTEWSYGTRCWVDEDFSSSGDTNIINALNQQAAASTLTYGSNDVIGIRQYAQDNAHTGDLRYYYIELTVYYTLPQPGGIMLGSFH